MNLDDFIERDVVALQDLGLPGPSWPGASAGAAKPLSRVPAFHSAGEMLKAVFVLADLESGGAQRVVLTVVRHLNRDRIEPFLVVVNPWGPLRRDLPGSLPVHMMDVARLRHAIPGLVRYLRRLRPDVVVTTVSHLNLGILAVRRFLPSGTRVFVREANTPSVRLQSTAHPKAYRFLYRRLYPCSDGILCNSQYMKQDMVGLIPSAAGRIHVIPNPVDEERVRANILRSGNPYRTGGINLVSVGRLNRQKGYDLLIRAVSDACHEVAGLSLTLVGDGPEAGVLKGLSKELGLQNAVVFAGHQDNPYPVMAHADLFVSSSRYEGSPNAVLESLACGTPVLAFDCPGGTGEIITEGLNGWLVPAEDTGAMAAKLIEIVRGRAWENMNAGRLLPESFECANAVRAYESLLIESAVNSSV